MSWEGIALAVSASATARGAKELRACPLPIRREAAVFLAYRGVVELGLAREELSALEQPGCPLTWERIPRRPWVSPKPGVVVSCHCRTEAA